MLWSCKGFTPRQIFFYELQAGTTDFFGMEKPIQDERERERQLPGKSLVVVVCLSQFVLGLGLMIKCRKRKQSESPQDEVAMQTVGFSKSYMSLAGMWYQEPSRWQGLHLDFGKRRQLAASSFLTTGWIRSIPYLFLWASPS